VAIGVGAGAVAVGQVEGRWWQGGSGGGCGKRPGRACDAAPFDDRDH
jgi:hypothetical protein